MYGVVIFIHILICVLLIVVVLLQQTRGGGITSVFGGGGGGTDTLFGGKGATPFFVRLTTGLAIGFFLTSLTLVLLSKRSLPRSAIDKGFQEIPAPSEPEGQPIIPGEPNNDLPIEPYEGGGR